ncbi:zinc ribbon domain-containing protein [Chloroflexota bacterium]
MPIYEYVCTDCESRFELLRPLSQSSDAASCPRCQQSAQRILSSFASFSTNDSGLTAPIGGNACSSCGSSSCGTCNM